MPHPLLPAQEIHARLEQLNTEFQSVWRTAGDRLNRDYEFPSFVQAFGFMTQVALLAEALRHHPDWSNSYGRVSVILTTYDSGGITELDFQLARQMEGLFQASNALQET